MSRAAFPPPRPDVPLAGPMRCRQHRTWKGARAQKAHLRPGEGLLVHGPALALACYAPSNARSRNLQREEGGPHLRRRQLGAYYNCGQGGLTEARQEGAPWARRVLLGLCRAVSARCTQ